MDTQRIIDRQQRICDIICEQDETKMPKFNTLQSIAEELKNRHGIDVCKQTVANDMEAIGFNSVARRETSALKPEHIEKRLAYSKLQFPDPTKILFSTNRGSCAVTAVNDSGLLKWKSALELM